MFRITYFWHEPIEDFRFRYAVIVSGYDGAWIFVRQAVRHSYELPAGRREPGESILQTARRELFEETGAVQFELQAICAFMVSDDTSPVVPDMPCGMLYLAQVRQLAALPAHSEIAEIVLSAELPHPLSYPEIQPGLFKLGTAFSHYRIRPARPSDAAAIQCLNHECMDYDYPIGKTEDQLTKIFMSPGDIICVAEEKTVDHVVGYIHLSDYLCTYADRLKNIMAVAVAPQHQGLGVGRLLLGKAERLARDQGAAGVRLVSGTQRVAAHSFYRACGYQLKKTQNNFFKLFA